MNDERQDHPLTREQKKEWWGEGPWCDEPDHVVGIYKDHGYKVMRTAVQEPDGSWFGGHLCGYVRLPKDHVISTIEDMYDIPVVCHGGITYATIENDGFAWIGFDCSHAMDYTPSLNNLKETNIYAEFTRELETFMRKFSKSSCYRDVDYCREQCKSIIDQLVEFHKNIVESVKI